MKQREYVNAQEMANKYPETFYAPTKENLDAIKTGDIVKVCTGEERFWAIVTEVNGEEIKATVDNNLVMEENEDLTLSTVISFKKENIYDIYQN